MTDPFFSAYANRLQALLSVADWSGVEQLAGDMLTAWRSQRRVFFCGNGGSAGNAVHLANDFLYGIAKSHGKGLNAVALPANTAVITCLANDLGYEHIYSEQLAVQAQPGDVLIAFSGSGNSPNIVAAIECAQRMGVKTYAIVGYSGGRCKALADVALHFPIDDMQISEDMQLIVGHMLMQWLYDKRNLRDSPAASTDL